MSTRRKKGKGRRAAARQSPEPRKSVQPRKSAQPQWALAGVLAASALGGVAMPLAAQAPGASGAPAGSTQLATRLFDIAAGPLDSALAQYARVSGLTVVDPKNLAATLKSPGASGTMSDEVALQKLLAGTGVTYRFTSGRSLTLQWGELPRVADATTTLPTLTVTGARARMSASPKYTAPLRDIPQTVTVVPNTVLEAQGASTLRDALRNVAGLTVNAGEGGATPGDNFNIRGFSARSDMFVDGVRDMGGYSRETFNLEQVEVTKGPGSVYMGRGSTGGAINVVTKSPQAARAYTGTIGVGTGDYQRATIDANQPIDGMGLKGAAARVNAAWENTGVAGLDVVERKNWGVAPSLAFGLGTETKLVLQYTHSDQDNIPSYGVSSNNTDGPPPDIDTHNYFGVRGLDFERVNADQGNIRVEHVFSPALTLRNQLSLAHNDTRRIVSFGNTNGTRRTVSHITNDLNVSNQANLGATFATGKLHHNIAAGVEVSHEHSRFASYRFSGTPPAIDIENPSPDDRYTGTYEQAPDRRNARADAVGVYAFETLRVSEHLDLTGGARWDYFSPQYVDSLGHDLEMPDPSSQAVTYRVGAVYKPTDFGSFYVALGTSFNPSGQLLALDGTGNSANQAGLDPETNKSYEIGTKWDLFDRRLSVTGAVFRTDKTNARITDPNDPAGQSIILAGKQRVDGFELGFAGHVIEGLSVFGGYTYLKTDVIKAATDAAEALPLPNTPKHSLTLWSTYRFPFELEIGGGARHISRRIMSATASVPPYWAFDAEASFPLLERMDLRLNVYNLSDKTYFDTARFWVPAAGRSVRLTTVLKY